MDYHALVLLFSFGGALAKGKVELELSKTELREGEDLTIMCKITDKGKFDIGRIYRRIDGLPDGHVESEISTNNGIAPPLKGRYINEDYKPDENPTVIKVKINGVIGADAGTIGCTKKPGDEQAEERITVLVPPKSVKMYFLPSKNAEPEEIPDGDEIVLQKGQENGIRCQVFVDGSQEKPKTHILLGEGEGAKDITSRFVHRKKKAKLVWDSGLLNETRNDTYTWFDKSPNTAESDQKITCKAELNDFEPIQTSATMRIHFMPEWADCEESWQVKPGTPGAKISCKARMFPPPSTSVWSIGKKPNRTILTDDQATDDNTYQAKVNNLGGNIYEYILTIGEVRTEHFGKKFKLEVANELGTIERKINLQEGAHPSAIPVDSGSQMNGVGFLVCLLSFVLLLWHH